MIAGWHSRWLKHMGIARWGMPSHEVFPVVLQKSTAHCSSASRVSIAGSPATDIDQALRRTPPLASENADSIAGDMMSRWLSVAGFHRRVARTSVQSAGCPKSNSYRLDRSVTQEEVSTGGPSSAVPVSTMFIVDR